eukprot:PhM_4_TR19043/c0_g1_i1/m.57313
MGCGCTKGGTVNHQQQPQEQQHFVNNTNKTTQRNNTNNSGGNNNNNGAASPTIDEELRLLKLKSGASSTTNTSTTNTSNMSRGASLRQDASDSAAAVVESNNSNNNNNALSVPTSPNGGGGSSARTSAVVIMVHDAPQQSRPSLTSSGGAGPDGYVLPTASNTDNSNSGPHYLESFRFGAVDQVSEGGGSPPFSPREDIDASAENTDGGDSNSPATETHTGLRASQDSNTLINALCHRNSSLTRTHLESLAERYHTHSAATTANAISKTQFYHMMTGSYNDASATPSARLFCDRVFSVFDLNGDGTITLEEYLTAVVTLCTTTVSQEKIELTFRLWDVDGDGFIEQEELTAIVLAAADGDGLIISPSQARELVRCSFGVRRGNRLTRVEESYKMSLPEYNALVHACPRILDMWMCDAPAALLGTATVAGMSTGTNTAGARRESLFS